MCSQQRQYDHSAGAAVVAESDHPCQDNTQENRQHLPHVGGQQISQELADVVQNAAPLTHGLDDGGEVIVRQNHFGGLLGHLGTRHAHRNADVGRFQRGRIVDAVTRHGDDVAVSLQRVDDAQLVRWHHPGVDRGLVHRRPEICIAQGVQLCTAERRRTGLHNAKIGRDAHCCLRMIARDHDDAYTGTVGLLDSHCHLSAWRVDDAYCADKNERVLQ